MRDKITSTKHYISVTVSNLGAPISAIEASSPLSLSVQGEKGAYPYNNTALSRIASYWLCLSKSGMKTSRAAMEN